jgi:hypothetical protein
MGSEIVLNNFFYPQKNLLSSKKYFKKSLDLLFFTPNSMFNTKKRSFLDLFYKFFKQLA